MKSLVDSINEGNITNLERKYREFVNFCTAYKVDPKDVAVERTSKNNWRVVNKEGKKIFLVSNYILNDEVIKEFKIKKA